MNLKRNTALALLALGVGSAAFAGTYTHACKSVGVTIPCERSAWDLGFEVFWVEATANDQVYTFDNTPDIDKYYSVGPDYSLGFELEASYHFGTGNDITVAWERAHDDNHAFNTQEGNQYTTYVQGQFATVGTAGNRHTGTHDYEFDAVNVEFGQHIDFGTDVDVRVHGGLQYARVDYLKIVKIDSDLAGSQPVLTYESDFEGVGARVGEDSSYNLSGDWSVVSHAAFSLLVGDIQTFAHDKSMPQNGFRIRAFDDVIPAAMVKSGFSYEADAMDGHVTVEGGWRWEGMFSSLRFYSTVGANYENFTFHGPYVSFLYVS